ncbi:ras-related protein Rab-37 isoform X5 [Macaca fascicularis]|uniref:ras-related protein Rab-37 isoform X5 n=1 Tax=Macaca fascicularis TaxID=9541 RepID=UPI003D15E16E
MDLQRPDSYQGGAGPDFNEHVLHKTILVGDSGVGKTSLLVQFDQGKFIPGSFSATVGIGFTPLCGTRDPSSLPYIPSPRIAPCLRLQLPLNSWEDLGRGFHSSLGLWQEEQGPPLGPQNRSILRWGRANISSWITRMFGSLWDRSTGPARSHSRPAVVAHTCNPSTLGG